jgi:hypothetical protein
MLNEYKKPMWNDGFAKDMPWLNYFNEYERTHCCFGGDGNGDVGDDTAASTSGPATGSSPEGRAMDSLEEDKQGYGEESGMTADQAAAAAAAADAAAAEAAAAGGSAADQATAGQAAVDISTAESLGMDIGDIGGGIGLSIEEIDRLDDLGLMDYNTRSDLGYFDKVDKSFALDDARQAAELTADLRDRLGLDVTATVGPDGTWSYEGPDAWKAFGGQLSKGISNVADSLGTGIGGLASAASMVSLPSILGALVTGRLESHPITAGMAGVPYESPYADIFGGGTPKATLGRVEGYEDRTQSARGRDDASLGAALGGLSSLGFDYGSRDPGASFGYTGVNDLSDIEAGYNSIGITVTDRSNLEREVNQLTQDQRDDLANRGRAHKAATQDQRIADRNTGGQVGKFDTVYPLPSPTPPPPPPPEEEEKTKSAMELYLEKLGKPSKYTVPTVPMDTPSMAPPPAGSDPFELAEYRKRLARETMGNYLPFDVGGASEALNTFNKDYYGGASNVSPYNMAQMASLLGLRGPGSYEGIIGMLGGVRNEPPPPPEPPIIEPEPPITPDDPYDDEGGPDNPDNPDLDWAAHGGGIGHILRRQAGGMTTHEGLQGFGMQSPRPFGITPFGGGLR